jgi:hypothetical protein
LDRSSSAEWVTSRDEARAIAIATRVAMCGDGEARQAPADVDESKSADAGSAVRSMRRMVQPVKPGSSIREARVK